MKQLRFVILCGALATGAAAPPWWPRFRGPDGSGVAEQGRPPAHFGPTSNVLWQTELPPGGSSPCIWGDRLFLTAHREGTLETLCLDRNHGRILWRQAAPAVKIEPSHRHAGPAAPTPATDGQYVYVYFGSFGLLAYDFEGREQWRRPLPPPLVEFGTASSPITDGQRVFLLCDQDLDSYLLAVDRKTGTTLWRVERPEFPRGFATPMLWRHDTLEELIVPGTLWLKALDPATGRERWRARGLARVVCTSPVAGDGLLFVASWTTGGDLNAQRLSMAPFDAYLAGHDTNCDGRITRDEVTESLLKERFNQIDLNKDGVATPQEWNYMADIMARVENQVLALRPGGAGDVSGSHVLWRQKRGAPYVASPLYYRGRLYTVKNGGLVSCFDARTGRPAYLEERLDAPGDYYASPIGADGRLYAVSLPGTVVVFKAGDTLEVLARNKLAEPISATPAVVGDILYVRTPSRMWAFGHK